MSVDHGHRPAPPPKTRAGVMRVVEVIPPGAVVNPTAVGQALDLYFGDLLRAQLLRAPEQDHE